MVIPVFIFTVVIFFRIMKFSYWNHLLLNSTLADLTLYTVTVATCGFVYS